MKIQNQSSVIYNAVEPDKAGVPGSLTSNTVETEVLSYSIVKTSSCGKNFVNAGETVRNSVTVTNNSPAKLTHAFISNPTPEGANFVEGSVKVNGVSQPDKNMINGFFLPDLNPGESITIEYELQVKSPASAKTVTDVSEFQYTVADPVRGEVSYAEKTDPILINIVSAKLSVVKSVDKAYAVKGETLTYTVTFTNEGNININDIYFTDPIPQGTEFVEKSVYINGQNVAAYRPDIGYSVASLPPADSASTSFQVKII